MQRKTIAIVTAALFSAAAASTVQAYALWGQPYHDDQLPVEVWGDEVRTLDACPGLSEYTGTAVRAYIVWNQVSGSKFAWTKGSLGGPFGSGPDGYNTIRFLEISDPGVLGQTSFSLYNNRLYRDADQQIDVNQNWQCGPDNPTWRQMDLQSVIAHEAGHKLGLDHSEYNAATMWWSIASGDASKRTLHWDDEDGCRAQYPQ